MDSIRQPLTKLVRGSVFVLLMLFFIPGAGFSQQPPVNWIEGSGFVDLGNDVAQTFIGGDTMFAGAGDTKTLMEYIGNPISNKEVGLIASKEGENWFIVFEYDSIGYVKDDEKESIDSDALLKTIKEATDYANKQRAQKGFAPLNVVGWYEKPHYDVESHNLVWALLGESENEQIVNYNTRLLGRYGYMSIVLVTDPETLDSLKSTLTQIVENFSYKEGKSYAAYVQGDKIAKYGLIALVAGGAGATAAKFGFFKFLAKGGKAIILAIIVFLGAAWAKIKSFFSEKSEDTIQVVTARMENESKDPDEALLNRIDALRLDGRTEDAIIVIKNEVRGKINNLDISRIYSDLLKENQQIPEWLIHSVTHLDLLSKEHQKSQAYEVYKECIGHNSGFTPTPKTLFEITQFLVQSGKIQDAYNACVHFTKVHPKHALIPEVYFFSAKILNEKLNYKARARQVMIWLIKKYPKHDHVPEMRKYLETMSKRPKALTVQALPMGGENACPG